MEHTPKESQQAQKPITELEMQINQEVLTTLKKTCDCAETSCPKGCTKQHTHKTFFCETCNPPDVTPKEEEIREIEIFSLPSQDELRNEWVEFLRSAPNVDAEAIEWIVANFVEEKLVDLLNSQIKIRREAIAEERERVKKIVKNIPTRCRICEKTGVNCYGECECSYEDKGYIKKTDVLLHLTQE